MPTPHELDAALKVRGEGGLVPSRQPDSLAHPKRQIK